MDSEAILQRTAYEKSLFTQLINALDTGDYGTASALQVEMYDKTEELKSLYDSYQKNII